MLIKDIVQEWLGSRRSRGQIAFTLSANGKDQAYQITEDFMTEYGRQTVLVAPCAVCGDLFETKLMTGHPGNKLQPKRTCKEHRGQYVPPRRQRAPRPRREPVARPRKAYVKPPRKLGPVGEIIMQVLDAVELLDKPSPELVARLTAARMPRGSGKEDQRYRVAKKALNNLLAKGRIAAL